MLKNYFGELHRLILSQGYFSKFSFWNCMVEVADHYSMPKELVTLALVNAIEENFPGKYKPNYDDNGILDVLSSAIIAFGSTSEEEEIRYSVINDFSNRCCKADAIKVAEKVLVSCNKYEKLLPYL